MELQAILDRLVASLPRSIGAVLCDFEGETVVAALGPSRAPAVAEAYAKEHLPRSMAVTMPVQEFLVRLAGAEPCALLRLFQAQNDAHGSGAVSMLELRFGDVDMIIDRLPNDFYLVALLRRPTVLGRARRHVRVASDALRSHVE